MGRPQEELPIKESVRSSMAYPAATEFHLSHRNTKNSYGLEERNSLLSKDPDVRKFDAERILCNICDQWVPVSSENHMQAVQKWLQHRSVCQKYVGQSATSPAQLEPSSSSRSVFSPFPLFALWLEHEQTSYR
jgi:hypothetical protein